MARFTGLWKRFACCKSRKTGTLQDGQPSTRQLLNSSQSIVASYTNDSFGNSVSSSGTAANPFKWNGGSGYYSDSESGLQKVGARYYDPTVGTWTSQDSLLIAGSAADSQAVNRYLYCSANPVGRVDPTGHSDSGKGGDDTSDWLKWGTYFGAPVIAVTIVKYAIQSGLKAGGVPWRKLGLSASGRK